MPVAPGIPTICPPGGHLLPTDFPDRLAEMFVRQVGVALRGPGAGVAQQEAGSVEGDASPDKQAGEAVAEIVEVDVIHANRRAGLGETLLDAIPPNREWQPGDGISQGRVDGDGAGLASFRVGVQPDDTIDHAGWPQANDLPETKARVCRYENRVFYGRCRRGNRQGEDFVSGEVDVAGVALAQ